MPLPRPRQTCVTRRLAHNKSASAKLFADAEAEDKEGPRSSHRTPRLSDPVSKHENWTGEENIRDAVLRMLVDKYKPLKVKESNELVIKKLNSRVRSSPTSPPPSPDLIASHSSSSAYLKGEHKPWLVTFKAPSHATITPAVKFGRIPPSPRAFPPSSNVSDDPRARAAARQQKKLAAGPGRLTKARDLTLDYRIGGSLIAVESARAVRKHANSDDTEEKAPSDESRRPRANPVSLRAWSSLIEDKIERARAKGQFDNLSGRGKPLARDDSESNPFIAPEEFLMNRIIKRNGAAPPWVETQQEVDMALLTFRISLQDSWTRRVIRTLTADRPPSTLVRLTTSKLASIRDPEWESRESSYLDRSISEVNSLIRKYNNMAPYAIRKPYILLRAELESCFETAAPRIAEELRARADGHSIGTLVDSVSPGQPSSVGGSSNTTSNDLSSGTKQKSNEDVWKFRWLLSERVRRWLRVS